MMETFVSTDCSVFLSSQCDIAWIKYLFKSNFADIYFVVRFLSVETF